MHTQFEKALVDLRVSFDTTEQISFFSVTPLSLLSKSEIERKAFEVAAQFFGKKFNEVFAKFDDSLSAQLPVDRLLYIWTQVTANSGTFERVINSAKDRNVDVVDVRCQLQGGQLIVRVGYSPQMKINGFFVLPTK